MELTAWDDFQASDGSIEPLFPHLFKWVDELFMQLENVNWKNFQLDDVST